MIIRVVNIALLAITSLYTLELTGTIPTRKYFPNLPRLEASATSFSSWASSATWGIAWANCMVHGQNASTCAETAGTGTTGIASTLFSGLQNHHTQVAFLNNF